MVYAESRKLGEVSGIEAEVKAVRHDLEYRLQNGLVRFTIETNSLITKKILDGV